MNRADAYGVDWRSWFRIPDPPPDLGSTAEPKIVAVVGAMLARSGGREAIAGFNVAAPALRFGEQVLKIYLHSRERPGGAKTAWVEILDADIDRCFTGGELAAMLEAKLQEGVDLLRDYPTFRIGRGSRRLSSWTRARYEALRKKARR